MFALGTALVLDNLNMHKRPKIREASVAVGCHLCDLPACSPYVNPIELALAKLKICLRVAVAWAFEPLLDAIALTWAA
jgi:hypothetical protein